MATLNSINSLQLEGAVVQAPAFSHENHETKFHRLLLQVPRLSGQMDVLPVLLPEDLAQDVELGQTLRLYGTLRSFNNKTGVGNRLLLSMLCQTVLPPTLSPSNHIALSGVLCKPPIVRQTPLGRSICDLMLAVPRRYGRADYIPAIAWGALSSRLGGLAVGDTVWLEGRLQSRVYQKTVDDAILTNTAYEVSIMSVNG